MKNCVYVYTNVVNGKKYVGQAKDFEKRHKQHIRTALNGDPNSHDYNVPFHRAIRKYGIDNFVFEIICDNLTKEEMDYWEIYYIKELDVLVKNNKGYNISSGGSKGNTFAGKTEEEMEIIKRKIGEYSKQRKPNLGRKWSQETKDILSEKTKERLQDKTKHPMYGKQHSEESKRKNSESRKGKCTGSQNGRARKVGQYTLDGELIKVWDCIKDVEKECNIKGVTGVCRGRRNSAGGFKWKYIEE